MEEVKKIIFKNQSGENKEITVKPIALKDAKVWLKKEGATEKDPTFIEKKAIDPYTIIVGSMIAGSLCYSYFQCNKETYNSIKNKLS